MPQNTIKLLSLKILSLKLLSLNLLALKLLALARYLNCLVAISYLHATSCFAAANIDQLKYKGVVDDAINPVMKKYDIPGVAIAISLDGKSYFYNYGMASKETKQPVTKATLFEIGSLSKTLTATLATYAQINGQLLLSENVSHYLPYLRGSSFDAITLINLGTHTAGDFPLQVPDGVASRDQLMNYYQHWKPNLAAGTHRVYSNLGIGLLGIVTAERMQMSFADAMEKNLFPKLGMTHSYIKVPSTQMKYYAQGYNKSDEPVRVNPGMLADEAYGVKSNSADLIRFINANMGLINLDKKLQRAITDTHTGYFIAGEITQDLAWEHYPGSAPLEKLLAGNSAEMIFHPTAATEITPPLPPRTDVLINKTGSTNGFGAYALYNPAKKNGDPDTGK